MNKTATQCLEDQMAERMATAMSEEIDWEVLSNMLVSVGWFKVELATLGSNKRAIDINNWMHTECTKHWKHRGKAWVFESRAEAALFRLTWA